MNVYKAILIFLSLIYLRIGMALECPPGKYFVSAFPRDSYYRGDGTFVSATTVEAHCRSYHFSSPLKIKFENQMPEGWPYQLDLFKKWTENEKKEVQEALNSLPEKLRNLGEIRVFRAVKSSFPNNHASSGPDNSIIVLYDSAKEFGYRQTFAHEMGHILFSKLNADEKEEYYAFSSWKLNRGKIYTSRKDFSELDGELSPEEDFANNIEHIVIKNGAAVNLKISTYLKFLLGLNK